MSYGWAILFTVAAWIVGSFLECLLGEGTHILFAILVMGCCIMKFIKDQNHEPH